MAKQADYDSPWKDALDMFFEQFIEFFFPTAYEQIDWTRGYEFLDKELQKITADAAVGRRYVDKLVKVWLKTGAELWVLVHAEVQGEREANFAERVYVYNYRIFDRFNRPVATFVVLTDEDKKWRPREYKTKLLGTSINLKFSIAKLLDYLTKWPELEQSRNPFAVIVQAHLTAQKTRNDDRSRLQEKLTLTKRLFQRGFSKQEIIGLYRFMDWVLTLPQTLEIEFQLKLKEDEEEGKMPYISNIELIGMKLGIEKVTLRSLERRFGGLDEPTQTRIRALPLEQLEELNDALQDFSSSIDLNVWLDENQPSVEVDLVN